MFKQLVTDYKYACIALGKAENSDIYNPKEISRCEWHCDNLAGKVLKACTAESISYEQLRDRLGKRFRSFKQFYQHSINWRF